MMTSVWLDLRYALRMMVKSPGMTAIIAITLALGIGASTTIFSIVNSVVLKPLPYKEPERLVRIYSEFHSASPLLKFWMSNHEYKEVERGCGSCESIAAWSSGSAVLAGGDRPVRVPAAYATSSLARTLGVQPMLGRWFDEKEDQPGDPTVVVLGHGVWQRAFNGDPHVVGQKITLDAMPVTIIGVMGPGFDFLDRQEAWVPLRIDLAKSGRGSHGLSVIARLKDGTTLEVLRAELDALVQTLGKTDGPGNHTLANDHPLLAVPFQTDLVGSIATALWLLQGAVLFVLLIAIVNIANLLLARSETRVREVAIRHALGASRRRLMRQFVTESLLLGLLGGALGVLASVWALDAIKALLPASAPRVNEIHLDGGAIVFAVACSLGAALLFGIAPIVHARKTDVHSALKDGSNRMTGSRARLRVRRALVISEIVLAVVLVVGCTVMVRSFMRLQQEKIGFDPENLLTFGIELPERTYPGTTPDVFWKRAQEGLASLPGVKGVALVDGLPPDRQFIANSFTIPNKVKPKKGERPWNVDHWQLVGDGALETLGARIVKGRGLLPSDSYEAPSVVVVNQAFADAFFPGEDPIGKPISLVWVGPEGFGGPEQTIVGVVENLKSRGIDKPAGTEVFIPLYQYARLTEANGRAPRSSQIVWFAIRTNGPPRDLIPAVTARLAELDATLPLFQVGTMEDVLWEAVARPRFLTVLLTAFAILALLLASVGIYGVMAHTVTQRTHEIGLRLALGAQPNQVAVMVLKQAGMLVVIGVAVGVALSLILEILLGGSLHGVFYGERLTQPLLLVGVALAVVVAAMLATWLPVRRATRVQPTVALRSE